MTIYTSPEQLGAIVRFHRKKAAITQKELANQAGVKSSTVIFELEKGKKHSIRLDTLQKIFKVLNIQIALNSTLMNEFATSKGK